jgi:hypothetical protein
MNHSEDSALKLYCDKLSVLVNGGLLAPNRLQTIVEFNLGMYDHWLKAYTTGG